MWDAMEKMRYFVYFLLQCSGMCAERQLNFKNVFVQSSDECDAYMATANDMNDSLWHNSHGQWERVAAGAHATRSMAKT